MPNLERLIIGFPSQLKELRKNPIGTRGIRVTFEACYQPRRAPRTNTHARLHPQPGGARYCLRNALLQGRGGGREEGTV